MPCNHEYSWTNQYIDMEKNVIVRPCKFCDHKKIIPLDSQTTLGGFVEKVGTTIIRQTEKTEAASSVE